jgi:hypothetical protein
MSALAYSQQLRVFKRPLGYEPKELFTALTLPLEVHFNSIDFAASMEAD